MEKMEKMVRPLPELQVTKCLIPAWRDIPNTSLQSKPLLIYHSVFDFASSDEVRKHLDTVGAVTPQWTYSMYTTDHFHSTTHEVLGVVAGRAKLCFGHEQNPDRYEPTVSRGDVIIVPAGVSHRLLEDVDGGFAMVGAYPPGKQWDMCYGGEEDAGKVDSVKSVRWFDRDPVYGHSGPVFDV
ncbi:cupin domain-containing protein [Arthroderma uncinatum]|uniref:cupin domain-containing protein n=1 Tax=Arthroderma uncinatum TaxID=74035 RepID=UPI00144AC406|nr:cupin domain-containing protein [Arthroderma uncinatum]KAF3482551.1 cupin domain-containing protein [Arthroderma uncinatum]